MIKDGYVEVVYCNPCQGRTCLITTKCLRIRHTSRFVCVILARLTDSPKSCSSRFLMLRDGNLHLNWVAHNHMNLVTLTQNMTFFEVQAQGILSFGLERHFLYIDRFWRPTFAFVLLLKKVPWVMNLHGRPTRLSHSSNISAQCSKNGLFKASIDLTRGLRRARTIRNSRGLLRTKTTRSFRVLLRTRNANSLHKAITGPELPDAPAQDRQREKKPAQSLKTMMSRPLRPPLQSLQAACSYPQMVSFITLSSFFKSFSFWKHRIAHHKAKCWSCTRVSELSCSHTPQTRSISFLIRQQKTGGSCQGFPRKHWKAPNKGLVNPSATRSSPLTWINLHLPSHPTASVSLRASRRRLALIRKCLCSPWCRCGAVGQTNCSQVVTVDDFFHNQSLHLWAPSPKTRLLCQQWAPHSETQALLQRWSEWQTVAELFASRLVGHNALGASMTSARWVGDVTENFQKQLASFDLQLAMGTPIIRHILCVVKSNARAALDVLHQHRGNVNGLLWVSSCITAGTPIDRSGRVLVVSHNKAPAIDWATLISSGFTGSKGSSSYSTSLKWGNSKGVVMFQRCSISC